MSRSSAHTFSSRDGTTIKEESELGLTLDLIAVLRPHRSGLRRWSVMRAMRNKREAEGGSIPQKFEDDIERVFRRLCASESQTALFYRPAERAGEVWALHEEEAKAWLETSGMAA